METSMNADGRAHGAMPAGQPSASGASASMSGSSGAQMFDNQERGVRAQAVDVRCGGSAGESYGDTATGSYPYDAASKGMFYALRA